MRSSLNVTLGFGLASIPVGLASLIDSDDSVKFTTLHSSCKTPLKEKKWCPLHDVEVPLDEQLKGFELSKAEYVLFTPDEVDMARPVTDGVVKLVKFVPEEHMPERHQWLKHYILIPDKVLSDRYGAFLDSLVALGMVGVGESVLWKKRRVCFVHPERFGKYLLLSTVNQAVQKQPDFGPQPYAEDTLALTSALLLQMSGTLKVEDTITEDPVRVMVEARMGVKRKKQAELKVSPVAEDFQSQLRASMQTKPSKKVKAKR